MDHEISGFGIKNFRIFEDVKFEFSPITILTGANNSGKSSLIKALLLVENYFKTNEPFFNEKIDFSTNLPVLGTFDSLVTNGKKKEVVFSMPFTTETDLLFNHDPNYAFELTFSEGDGQNKEFGLLKRIKIFQPQTKTIFLDIEYTNLKHRMADERYEIPGKKVIVKSNLSSILQRIFLGVESGNLTKEKNEDNVYQFILPVIGQEPSNQDADPWANFTSQNSPNEVFIFNPFNDNVHFAEKLGPISLPTVCSQKINTFPFIKVEKIRRPLFRYNYKDAEEICLKKVVEIESIALKTISNGQCSFEGDKDYLDFLGKKDIFFDAVYKDNTTSVSKIDRGYSFADKENPERIEYNFFILLFHEVVYQLYSSEKFNNIEIDYEYYLDMYNIDPGYLYIDLIGSENPTLENIENFYNACLIEIIRYFKKNLQFEYLPSARTKVRRVLHKEIEQAQFYKLVLDYHSQSWKNSPEHRFVKYWLSEFKLGQDLIIERGEGTISTIYLLKENRKRNIADLGTGVSQFLPILLTVVLNAKKKNVSYDSSYNLFPSSILIIEEPESNFHPKLQSKLAEFFIDASSKFNMKFIIETHSEYFIRKLQYWVARKIIRSNDIGIYYFPERTTSKEQNKIRKIHILNDGSLDDDFGPGFFDEATNWQWEMMRLKNSQNN